MCWEKERDDGGQLARMMLWNPLTHHSVPTATKRYKADKRPAFQQVAATVLAHDDAMHAAGARCAENACAHAMHRIEL